MAVPTSTGACADPTSQKLLLVIKQYGKTSRQVASCEKLARCLGHGRTEAVTGTKATGLIWVLHARSQPYNPNQARYLKAGSRTAGVKGTVEALLKYPKLLADSESVGLRLPDAFGASPWHIDTESTCD